MRGLSILLVVVAGAVNSAKSDSNGSIVIEVDAASVEIKPLADVRRLISLPSLEFSMSIKAQCATDMQAESMTISVADTRRTYSAAEFDAQAIFEVEFTIPKRQIGPLAVEEFCRSGERDHTLARILRVNDAFTAHLSLRCAGDDRQSILYASQALHLDLRCQIDDQNPGVSANQEISAPSTRK